VASKEEVAAGRKGGGGAWGSTSRNAGLAGPAPQNGPLGCSNFERFLHTASKLGSKLCSAIYTTPPRKQPNNMYQAIFGY
jgi:hypothetical protein